MFEALGALHRRPAAASRSPTRSRRSDTPLLLISGERGPEYEFNVEYAAAAGGPAEHWNMPDVSHTRGLHDRPAEYERRVLAFLEDGL